MLNISIQIFRILKIRVEDLNNTNTTADIIEFELPKKQSLFPLHRGSSRIVDQNRISTGKVLIFNQKSQKSHQNCKNLQNFARITVK